MRCRIVQREVSPAALAALPDTMPGLLKKVFAARNITVDNLDTTLSAMLPVSSLSGTDAAAERLLQARLQQQSVLVVGDFDADGATATAVVLSCLRRFGFVATGYRVPDRFRFGYGLSAGIVEEIAATAPMPDLIVTVDNGISSIQGVEAARHCGIDVIITDHHLPGPVLPDANVIVNPCLPGSEFGSQALAGVGVAFYVMAALSRRLAADGLMDAGAARRVVAECLDLVALGTVADLVPLDHNNRVLVAQGLARMRGRHARPGISALFDGAGRDVSQATTADLGFAIAPRLNAAGRLDDMSLGIECLLSGDTAEARRMAAVLSRLNQARRQLQADMERDAEMHVEAALQNLGELRPPAFCLFDPCWHQGVVGLVASRIKERVKRPVIAFAPGEDEGILKGSGRSVAGVHLRDLLATVDVRYPGLITRFGGHAMAAGLSLQQARLDEFCAAFIDTAEAQVCALGDDNTLFTDGELASEVFSMETAEQLRHAAPWGQGFPEPSFHGRFTVLEQRVVGGKHLKLTLGIPDDGLRLSAIAFNTEPLKLSDDRSRCMAVYRLDINEYQGRRSLQLVVEYIECD